jgi:hypothetical protein
MEIITLHEIDKSNSSVLELAESSEAILRSIPEYALILDENKISKMIIAGTYENTFVKAKCLFNYCFAQYFKDMVSLDDKIKNKAYVNYKKQWARTLKNWTELLGDDELFQAKLILTKTKNRNRESGQITYMISESGLLAILLSQKKDCILSTTFRKYITKFLSNIKRFHLDAFLSEKERTKDKMIADLTNKVDELENKIFNNTNYINFHNTVHNLFERMDNELTDTDQFELNIYRVTQSKVKINVYILDPKTIKDDAASLYDNFDSYNLLKLNDIDINTNLYFYLNKTTIKKTNSLNYIHTLMFYNAEHYKSFIEQLEQNNSDFLPKDTYDTTYADIISIRQRTFIKIHESYIKEKVAKHKGKYENI